MNFRADHAANTRCTCVIVSSQAHSQFWHENFEYLALLPGGAIVVPKKMKSPNGFSQQLPFLTQSPTQASMIGVSAVIAATYSWNAGA